jgi:hypothetical protein
LSGGASRFALATVAAPSNARNQPRDKPWHLLFDRPAAVAMNVIDHRASRWHLMRYKHVELIFSNDRNDPRGEPVAFVIP